jgi:capsular polysaccharide biosynthesis protein
MVTSGDGGTEDRRRATALLLAASERFYGALLVLYPKAFRNRYAAEMRQDFAHLSREGLDEGGGTELARVWGAAFSDLAVTALKERGTTLARYTNVPIEPRIVARLMVAVVLLAVTVTAASLTKTPQYEASAKMLVGLEQDAPRLDEHQALIRTTAETAAEAAQSRTIAEHAIERLGLSTTPKAFMKRLDAEPIVDTMFIEVSYTDPDPQRAQRVANVVGDELSRRVSGARPSVYSTTATLWQRAQIPQEPVSPNPLRNGLLTLVLGLMFCVGLAFLWPRVSTSTFGQAARAMARPAGLPASAPDGPLVRSSLTEAAKEEELLRALGRRGELTATGAALDTSLSVEEADRVLSGLAAKGYLQVRVRDGGIYYSFWQSDAPA